MSGFVSSTMEDDECDGGDDDGDDDVGDDDDGDYGLVKIIPAG